MFVRGKRNRARSSMVLVLAKSKDQNLVEHSPGSDRSTDTPNKKPLPCRLRTISAGLGLVILCIGADPYFFVGNS